MSEKEKDVTTDYNPGDFVKESANLPDTPPENPTDNQPTSNPESGEKSEG